MRERTTEAEEIMDEAREATIMINPAANMLAEVAKVVTVEVAIEAKGVATEVRGGVTEERGEATEAIEVITEVTGAVTADPRGLQARTRPSTETKIVPTTRTGSLTTPTTKKKRRKIPSRPRNKWEETDLKWSRRGLRRRRKASNNLSHQLLVPDKLREL